ncbi:MAG: hypothetical protein A2539_01720 [Elusimicrobia bacterium RIFOXYD2_FULL_34_15]|nr:MAG: hypothetical protein A2539_01720 [Elusimicrobia bacterium RIFOXYD2_FULL_34_15]
MKNEIEVTGKTVDEAVEKGLKKLKIERKDAEIKILDEGKSGLFGLMGSTPALIKISSKKESSSSESIETKSSAEVTEEQKGAVETLSKILDLAGFKAEVSTSNTIAGAYINVSCQDSAILIGGQGQTMDAFEYLLKLILSKKESKSIKVSLNIDGYLDRRNEKVIKKAKELEEKVKTTGEPITLKLPSSERKIIHITLESSDCVETVSEGEGEDRKLIIKPKKA